MLLKLSRYKLKLECYNFGMLNVTLMVTTKKIAIEYIQKKIGKILIWLTIKINQTQNKTVMQEMRDKKTTRHIENKYQNDKSSGIT